MVSTCRVWLVHVGYGQYNVAVPAGNPDCLTMALFRVGVNDTPLYDFIDVLDLPFPLKIGTMILRFNDGGIYPRRIMALYNLHRVSYRVYPPYFRHSFVILS